MIFLVVLHIATKLNGEGEREEKGLRENEYESSWSSSLCLSLVLPLSEILEARIEGVEKKIEIVVLVFWVQCWLSIG